uniref:Fungal lipase-type domain-containing protein n=1 Tax=Rhizophora mucronata TaxID=61149 RepID=A0A2P2JXP6_RHIMU
MAQPVLFSSGTEQANLVVSSGLLHHSWSAILGLYAEVNAPQQQYVRWSVIKQPNCTIIAFVTLPNWSIQHHLLQGGELVSSATFKRYNLPQFDFLTPKGNPSFSIHREAISLFASCCHELSQLRSLEAPLIITGHSLGGSVASLFTLWLLDSFDRPSPKRPLLCITFGCPLLGDKGLQQAISESSQWSGCFLHIAAAKDPIPSLFTTPSNLPISPYKPFGTFLLCSESGCTCVEDPEAVSELLKAIGLERTRSQVSNGELPIDYYGKMVKYLESGLIFKGNSQLVQSVEDSISAGIILQLEAIGDSRILVTQSHYPY